MKGVLKNQMLTAVKNQIKVIVLSLKYNIMRQMINKVTFLSNIIFMILNDASFIVQWAVLFSIRDVIGGYTLKEVLLIWGIAANTFAISHLLFYKTYEMPDLIINGKLDSFLVQPKNVFLSVITSDTSISAIGDLIYAYICLIIYGFSIKNFILFTLFSITGAIILTSVVSIAGSLCFWITKGDILADSLTNIMINFATYPGTIFKGVVKIILYTIIPVGIANYMPVDVIINFNAIKFLYIIAFTIFITALAFVIFYKGLKRYSSANLMGAKL